ncbi:MAG TPA: efflux RND transporter periplasmic adaptor subunit [Terracidiphilus sp.]|nr:efflux RND transporter periplasmic adaptor subunit [Terracidiphilus sp.]
MSNESKPNPQQQPRQNARSSEAHEAAPEQEPLSPRKALAGVGILVAVAIVLAVVGIVHRSHADTVLARDTQETAAPTVSVAPAKPGAPVDEFVLPGNVTAYTDAPIYARTDGYLVHWYYDIGARVKKGDLLAVIATPELDQQLAQAQADLVTAQTNAGNAKVQADRYKGLVDSNAVSRLDTDTFITQAASTSSAVKSAEANVQRLKELQSFERVYAPFDGVVTARNIDTGQLINQGAGTEMFHLQALQTLRVYANVPQVYSQSVRRGMKIALTFPEHPGKTFQGTLVRTADAIDPVSRTLLVEIDVANRDGQLLPGALAQVHFKTPYVGQTFIVPTAALIFRKEGLEVGTVAHANGNTVAHLVHIAIGEDDGATAQVVSGLKTGDEVIQDPPDSLIEGQRVTVVQPGGQTDAGGFE